MKDYKDKWFSFLGDSISTFEGISIPEGCAFYNTSEKLASGVVTSKDTWWGIVIDRLGAKLLVNNSISGSTVCWNRSYEYPSYGCSDERTAMLGANGVSPDVIVLYLGTNDWGRGAKPTSETLSTALEDCTVFRNAYSAMIEKIKHNYPDAEICCCTLALGYRPSDHAAFFQGRIGTYELAEYCDVIRDCAKTYGCRLIELHDDKPPFETFDGYHPTAYGMQVLANNFLSDLS